MVVVPMLLRDGVVGKSSWKEREVGKSEVGKFLFKLERAQRNLKEPSEIGKNPENLERNNRSWKVSFEKFRCSWKALAEVGKFE